MNVDRLKDFLREPGRRLGRFEIVREVGRGGMGVVYEAYDPDLRRAVAIKELRRADADRLRREAAAAAKLRHPNIVTVHEVGPDFIAMEFVAGRTFAEAMASMPRRRRLEVVETVARAVAYAHGEGVVHRDLKPGNILIDAGGRALLTDFGLAGAPEGSIAGTPGYMAPAGLSGPAADVWALGVLAREAGARGSVPSGSAAEVAAFLRRRLSLPRRLAGAALALAAAAAVWALWPRPTLDPKLQEWREREEDLTRRLDREPDRVEWLIDRADIRRDRTDYGRNRGTNPLPDYAGAESDLTRALGVRPGSPELLFRRGLIRTQRAVYKIKYGIDPLTDCASAEEDLTKAIEWHGARTWRGNVRFQRGVWRMSLGGDPAADFEAAEADFTPPDTPERLMRRGRLRSYQKRFDEAERDFDECLRRSNSVWGWTWRGNARLAAGDAAGAEQHYARAIAADREFTEAWEQRGRARLGRGDFAGAASDLEEALRLNPSLEPLLSPLLQESRRSR